jgi:cytidyltransferase-like protein
MSAKRIMVSGGFDPIHIGHIRMILEASKFGDVIVVVNSDAWLKRKKGYVFMPWPQRAEIIESIRGVISVEPVDDSDGTVCEALCRLTPDIFANGGDRADQNTPEVSLCHSLNIGLEWNTGGGKIQSSSELVEALENDSR